MQYFVLSNNNNQKEPTITSVIYSDIDMHRKSAKFVPVTKESLATYQTWMKKHPDRQPTVADIFSTNNTISTNASVSKPLSQPAAKPSKTKRSNRSALAKQFQQFINKH